jgi:hypothetical protein
VYYEIFGDIRKAIARERQIKRWRREKKIWLIERMNRNWKDLSDAWNESNGVAPRLALKRSLGVTNRNE